VTLTAPEVARAVRAGELHQAETVEQALRALEAHAELNAVITLCAEEALARAWEAVDGPLAGVPLLVKDVFDTAGIGRRPDLGSLPCGYPARRRRP
jgi:Asp-tRNA(Asn)/Glu-tRNA(Gln) amidotransferase A subunit family amidase